MTGYQSINQSLCESGNENPSKYDKKNSFLDLESSVVMYRLVLL